MNILQSNIAVRRGYCRRQNALLAALLPLRYGHQPCLIGERTGVELSPGPTEVFSPWPVQGCACDATARGCGCKPLKSDNTKAMTDRKKASRPVQPDDLRTRAEEAARGKASPPHKRLDPAPAEETQRLLHELQVHQIELEMQNKELQAARASAENGLEQYQDLFDFAPVGYFTLTRKGLMLAANLTGAALLGTARSQLIGRGLARFVIPKDLGRWDEHLLSVLRAPERQACDLGLRRKDGSLFYARLESIRLDRPAAEDRTGGPHPAMRVAMSDITERKQIEDAHVFLSRCGCRPTEENFFKSLARYLSESLGMDFVCIDRLVGDGLAAKTLAMYDNGAFQDNVEYTLKDTPCGDVVGKMICCFPESVCRLFPKDEVLQTMKAESYVGATLWGFDGKPIGLIAVIGRKPLANPGMAESVLKVVSLRAAGELQRAQAEEAIRSSEERHRSYIEVTGQLGWTTDAAGEVTEDLPAWRRYTGQTSREIAGWGWAQALHPDDVVRATETWRKATADKRNYEIEYRIRRHDGVYRHFMVRGVPVLQDDGSVREWVGTCIDRTENKQAEEALQRVSDELRRSNADLEQFATVISHDLQEPLRAVTGFADLLHAKYRGRLDARADALLAGTADGAARMQRQIDDLLSYSRVGTSVAPPLLLPARIALDAALANLAAAVAEAGAVVTSDPLPEVFADRTQLVQLFQNLVGNAIKFRGDSAPSIHVGARRQQEHWLFSVRDNGIGVDPAQQHRIFEIFQRLHSRTKYSGTGIGLAICKRIVERHGGRIWVDSRPGRGATFFFTLGHDSSRFLIPGKDGRDFSSRITWGAAQAEHLESGAQTSPGSPAPTF